jgi:AcrR family transcriptional regulator
MRYGPEQKEATRTKILTAAGRGFRRRGYGGVGVDELAKEAGVTSGAFYGHFGSKGEAFEAAALSGLVELCQAIETFQATHGGAWLGRFVDFYLSTKRTCELGGSCGLQTLTPEVARADSKLKAAYEVELLRVVEATAKGLPGKTPAARRKLAWGVLASLSGGVTLARAVNDSKLGAQVAAAIKTAIDDLLAAAAT